MAHRRAEVKRTLRRREGALREDRGRNGRENDDRRTQAAPEGRAEGRCHGWDKWIEGQPIGATPNRSSSTTNREISKFQWRLTRDSLRFDPAQGER